MGKNKVLVSVTSKRVFLIFICCILGFSTLLYFSRSVSADEPKQETEHYCLSCHNEPDLEIVLPSGESLSLYIPTELLETSIHHLAGIECQACHTDIKTYPHPKIEYNNKRELSLAYYQACQKCHPANYEKTLDSMHAQVANEGNLDAPVCTDCHGSHIVKEPDQPRSLISSTCGNCHNKILDEYKSSIHGGALLEQDNPDVPVCTDCHGVHNIQDARTAQFRIESPDLCASCHADAQLMEKYGLSADVYDLYEFSWHGVDVSVYKAIWPTIWHESAVCTDCHGVHNIHEMENPDSTVHPTNILSTCQQCHPNASSNWTDAWVGHNKINAERTPYLYYIDTFYSSFTPIILVFSFAYVMLQIIHNLLKRVRRNLP